MAIARYGLTFETYSPIERSQHLRADVALFVGFVAPRRVEASPELAREEPLRDFLRLSGFGARATSLKASPDEEVYRSVATLSDTPIPIEGWSAFDELFAWERRPITDRVHATTYLGAAVRAFFAQGGRKAYVVRVGDPWPRAPALAADATERARAREERIAQLLPGASDGAVSSPTDRETWRGIAHLFGLADASFVLMPDLPDIVDASMALRPIAEPTLETEEVFVRCTDEIAESAAPETLMQAVPPPACDDEALRRWAEVVSAAVSFLRRHRVEAELVAAIPLSLEEGASGAQWISSANPLERFYDAGLLRTRQSRREMSAPGVEDLTSAFLQLATPWVKTLGSSNSPGEVEPPDGTLAGVLARSVLERGTFRSAAGSPVPFVYDFVPNFGRSTLLAPIPSKASDRSAPLNLLQRACVFGRAPGGVELLSDVTTSADENYRSAGASRLVGAVLRAARSLGEEITFEPSSERAWAEIRARFRAMLLELWNLRALRGRTPAEAFQVRCDRSTMTQADIDAGRVIVHVQMEVAVAIESIRVVLSLTEGGRVSLLTGEGAS